MTVSSPQRMPAFADPLQPSRPRNYGSAHEDPSDAYQGVPILQQPAWHHEVAAYFYLGGISSGAFILGTLADLSGPKWRPLAETAHLVAFAAMVPCAPLLIADLGMPSRFYHMLRIFKPSSPMNLGSWTLVVHSGFSTLLAAQVLAEWGRLPIFGAFARHLPSRILGAAGLLSGMTLGGYTGVLVGTTSVPVWSTSPMLGGLFMASAIATGTSAVSMASILSSRDTLADRSALGSISLVAGASEMCLMGGYLATSGKAATPLLKGLDGALLLGAVTASASALAVEITGKHARTQSRVLSALAAGATLAGGAMLRWAV
ncbi:MAG TPA: NrfD/PsrC family molybdoenzyme membrane anchor subunit, partial [Chloroflexota bacterium]|nr:NrfD/PsrC family molybdoenzyme membrane anchor subunit [Chloroflexota bacterium]